MILPIIYFLRYLEERKNDNWLFNTHILNLMQTVKKQYTQCFLISGIYYFF